MLATFLRYFLDGMCANALDFWYGERHWPYFPCAVRRQPLLKIISKNVTNIWKYILQIL